MKRATTLSILLGCALAVLGAVVPGMKISQYPNVTTLDGTELLLLAKTNASPATNANILVRVLPTALSLASNANLVAASNVLNTKIDTASNALDSKINTSSNVMNTKINTASNVLDAKINTASNGLDGTIVTTSNYFQALGVGSYTNQEFSIVMLGDCQVRNSNPSSPPEWTNLFFIKVLDETRDWITSRIDSLNIKALMFTGDIGDEPTGGTWPAADLRNYWSNNLVEFSNRFFYPIASKIPFFMTPGNHDLEGGSGEESATKNLFTYVRAFPTNLIGGFSWWNGGWAPSAGINSTWEFYCDVDTAPIPFTVVSLNSALATNSLNWAQEVFNQKSNRFGILLTHGWLMCQNLVSNQLNEIRRGETYDQYTMGYTTANGVVTPNAAWHRYVRKYPGLRLIFSGHTWDGNPFIPPVARQQSVGYHGNTVNEIRQDFQNKQGNPDYWGFGIVTINPGLGKISYRSVMGTNWAAIPHVAYHMTNFPWMYNFDMPIEGADPSSGKLQIPGVPYSTNVAGTNFTLFPILSLLGSSNNWHVMGNELTKELVFASTPETNYSAFSNRTGVVSFDQKGFPLISVGTNTHSTNMIPLTTNIPPIMTPLGLFGYMGRVWSNGLVFSGAVADYTNVFSSGAPDRVLTNQFHCDSTLGFLTNLVAGYYKVAFTISAWPDVDQNTDEIEAEVFFNEVAQEYLASFVTCETGLKTHWNMNSPVYIPANTAISLRMKNESDTSCTLHILRVSIYVGTP